MRLINTTTLLLEDFRLRQVPERYAILSHTWTGEEVTYQEFINPTAETAAKEGYLKIAQACRLARADQLDYIWIDTCCIDKTSSAELSEAINSMFQWYQNAWVCYAYLSDLPKISGTVTADSLEIAGLGSCRWFKRGWTLQELIAPTSMFFYDETWTYRGSKEAFCQQIQQITKIRPGALRHRIKLGEMSVAERMTWASGRQTTRVEDMAYCLLGIFDINMPLLYGEGEKAFTRLQHEIIRNTNDLSIFGWSSSAVPITLSSRAGLRQCCPTICGHSELREHTFDRRDHILAGSGDSFNCASKWDRLDSVEHSVTNRGIRITCTLLDICLNGCHIQVCKCCKVCRNYFLPIASRGPQKHTGNYVDQGRTRRLRQNLHTVTPFGPNFHA